MGLTGVNNKSDTIAIIAPSSPFTRDLLLEGVNKMESIGFKLDYDERIFARGWGELTYFAGSPKERAEEIMNAFENPRVKAIIAARGGYGSNLVAERLDFKSIKQNPKIFMGFSDLTFLLNLIHQKTGLTTFHGPMLGSYRFLSLIKNDFDLFKNILENPLEKFELSYLPSLFKNPAHVEGKIIGGNLTLLSNMLGTDFDFSTKGNILFLEDTNEPPYKIDRNLVHLKQAGKLDGIKAIVFGELLACGITNEMLFNILSNLEIKAPVLVGFPAGHGERNVVVPIGGQIQIDPTKNKIILKGC